MNTLAVANHYLELELLPNSDLRAIARISEVCEGVNLEGIRKVIVIFIRTPLTSENFDGRFTEGEGDCQFECFDPDHI